MLTNVEELERNLGKHSLVWDEIAPRKVAEWLDMCSNGCSKELVLINMMAMMGALNGDSTVELFSNWKENGNLFLVALAQSGK